MKTTPARLPLWLAAALLVLPQGATGLGFGEIELRSVLNQPLAADVGLTGDAEVEGLTVRIAPLEQFERLGLEPPPFLSDLRVNVTAGADGRPRVTLSSTRPVREPLVTLLLEARWPRGSLLREYTLLLDPPSFASSREQVAATFSPTMPELALGMPELEPPAQTQGTPSVAPAAGEGSFSAPMAATAAAPSAPPASYVVRRNDTLYEIAERLLPTPDISVDQMMLALLAANPHAFEDENINWLLSGAVLRMPDPEALRRLSAAQARAEVRQHHSRWRERQAAAVAAAGGAPRLQLVTPSLEGEPGTGGGGRDPSSPLIPELAARMESLEDETRSLREEVQGLHALLEESRRLVALRDEQLAELQRQLAAALEAASQPVAEANERAPVAGAEVADRMLAMLPGTQLWTVPGLIFLLLAVVLYRRQRRTPQEAGVDGVADWQDADGLAETQDSPDWLEAAPAAAGDWNDTIAVQPSPLAGEGENETPWHEQSLMAPANLDAQPVDDSEHAGGAEKVEGFVATGSFEADMDFGQAFDDEFEFDDPHAALPANPAESKVPAAAADDTDEATVPEGLASLDDLRHTTLALDAEALELDLDALEASLAGTDEADEDPAEPKIDAADTGFAEAQAADTGSYVTGSARTQAEDPESSDTVSFDTEPAETQAAEAAGERGELSAIDDDFFDFDLDSFEGGEESALEAGPVKEDAGEEAAGEEGDATGEVGTKLDLANAYVDMGDSDGARSILQEVLAEGDEGQRKQAEQLLASL